MIVNTVLRLTLLLALAFAAPLAAAGMHDDCAQTAAFAATASNGHAQPTVGSVCERDACDPQGDDRHDVDSHRCLSLGCSSCLAAILPEGQAAFPASATAMVQVMPVIAAASMRTVEPPPPRQIG